MEEVSRWLTSNGFDASKMPGWGGEIFGVTEAKLIENFDDRNVGERIFAKLTLLVSSITAIGSNIMVPLSFQRYEYCSKMMSSKGSECVIATWS